MLDPFSRTAIVGFASVCVAATLALAPIGARGSLTSTDFHPAAMIAAMSGEEPGLRVARDPFDEPSAPPLPPPGASKPPAAALQQRPETFEPLPSNLPTDVIPAIPGESPDAVAGAAHVTAVVTGAHPYALVELNGVNAIKGVGDRIGSSTISAIDIDGIRLEHGERLGVARSTP